MEWKVIPNTNGKYEASEDGDIRNSETKRILKKQINMHGYYILTLRIIPNEQLNVRVHRLVAETFLGDSNGRIINHKDGNKLNNNIYNLEWISSGENNKHAYDIGLKTPNMDSVIKSGENHYRSTITEEIVLEILKIHDEEGLGCRKIAKRLNISHGVVNGILIGKTWKDVVKKYKNNLKITIDK